MAKVYHMVVVQFKPGTSDAVITQLFRDLDGLRAIIPGLEQFHGGRYSSPEGLNKGFTHGFVMTFRDAASRDGYLAHPDHEQIKNAILPQVADIVAFDFEE